MKKLLDFILLSMFGFLALSGNAQDTFFQKGNETSEERARLLTEAYQPELVMTGDQTLLFEKKLEEFLIREEEIKGLDVSPEDKLVLLTQLSEQQTAEMSNILTRPQLKRFTKVKYKLQPIAVVVDTVETKNK